MARAKAAKVSIIMLTHSICTAVRIACYVYRDDINTITTATTLIVS